jgi:hypothetical protein
MSNLPSHLGQGLGHDQLRHPVRANGGAGEPRQQIYDAAETDMLTNTEGPLELKVAEEGD